MLNDVSTVVLFLELSQRASQYSTGKIKDQFFSDVEESSIKSFVEFDKAMQKAFEAQARTVMLRIVDEDH